MLSMSDRRALVLLALCALLGCSGDESLEGVTRASAGAAGSGQDVEVEESAGANSDAPAGGTVSPTPSGADTAGTPDLLSTVDAAGESGAAPDASDGTDVSTVALETIHYYGRWNRLADRAITVNTGSHVVARFTGTGVSARFDVTLNQTPNPTLTWRIDAGEWQEGELAATLPLGTGLAAGTHELTLMARGLNEFQARWAPPLVSSLTFLGFDVAGGALEMSPRPVRPKIELLGDSITEGVNLWPIRTGMDTPCWRGDGRLAYASQTAQALGAEWRQVGFGRQGLLIGGNGGVPTANNAFNFMYQGVQRDDWQPDLVTINQGTNDGGATAVNFRTAYTQFVTTLRAAYPDAKIAALRPFNGAHAAEIQTEVAARNAAGDARVYYIDTTGWLVAADYTDGLHPNAQGSQKAANALVSAIRTIGLP
ncbi:MAG: GDSL-type esterase/lipase family protein [Deltaproteobacteria bacterium]